MKRRGMGRSPCLPRPVMPFPTGAERGPGAACTVGAAGSAQGEQGSRARAKFAVGPPPQPSRLLLTTLPSCVSPALND